VQLVVDTVAIQRAALELHSRALGCSELALGAGRLGAPVRAVEVAVGLGAFTSACAASFSLLAVDIDLVTATVTAAARAYAATEATVGDLSAQVTR
jgi:hypothetical protein